jgi:hypothetical protein
MVNFDAPNREQSCTRRERSNTPLQALQLLNDVQHVEAARGLAQRALLESASDTRSRIAWLFKIVLAREPSVEEIEIVTRQWAEHLARYNADDSAAKRLISIGESKPNPNLAATELAAATLIASTLLNMDEMLCRN